MTILHQKWKIKVRTFFLDIKKIETPVKKIIRQLKVREHVSQSNATELCVGQSDLFEITIFFQNGGPKHKQMFVIVNLRNT